MLKIAYSSIYRHPLPDEHRFPMIKYELLPEQLLYEGTVNEENFFEPGAISESLIILSHEADYWQRLRNLQLTRKEEIRTGFPHSKELIDREQVICEGTLQCALYALEYGVAMNIAGGTHHAFTDRGEGFCLLNDIAIAANYLLKYHHINKVLVVDLDVHQGNGTAQIFQDNPQVFTFSMHGERNYPLQKERSDLDIGLPDGTDDRAYLKVLSYQLPKLIEEVAPEFVFFQSGVDVLASDRLGKLSLTVQGCKERDRIVLEACKTNRIPVMASMGGGYSSKVSHIVEAHANTYRLAQFYYF
ncbi:histone deacetylase [Rapidithrix thailandica]|uniref:Histone deacetylase n=1 Tax=Rapidithrix thailandica TaxID=413964 RepID=A0AAW9S0Z8_9BACT